MWRLPSISPSAAVVPAYCVAATAGASATAASHSCQPAWPPKLLSPAAAEVERVEMGREGREGREGVEGQEGLKLRA